MKLCFSTLGCSDRGLEQILALASDYKISAIEIRGIGGILDNSRINAFQPSKLNATASEFKKHGVRPLSLGTSCAFHDPEKYDAALSEGRYAVELAEALEIPNIRVFGNRLKTGSTERIITGISKLCSLSQKVNILLEVHGDYNTAEALSPVIDALKGFDNFGIIWDIEHTHKPYGDRWLEFYSAFRPYVRHVHIKDRTADTDALCLVGDGDIPIREICVQLLRDGYDGYFSLEWEKKWHPELPEIEKALNSFIQVMSEVEYEC